MFKALLYIIYTLSISEAKMDDKNTKIFTIKMNKMQFEQFGRIAQEKEEVLQLIKDGLVCTCWEKADNKFSLTFCFTKE